jgi:P-type Ca2+ transporter type 2C
MNWYNQTVQYTLEYYKTSLSGLNKGEVTERLEEYGENKLPEGKPDGLFVIFLRQFSSPLIYILIGAAVAVLFLGERVDALIIMFVLLFNAIMGAVQEGKAQNTLRALKQFTKTTATVIRGGKEFIIPDTGLVPGDIMVLRDGQKIAADARVIISNGIKINEASLTGESMPVAKDDKSIDREEMPMGDQKNMVFKGTYVVAGAGKAVIVATGSETEIGKISQKVAEIDTEIPLKKDIRHLSRAIIVIAALTSSGLFIIGTQWLGFSLKEMFAVVVSLTVSFVPEGLPIVLTLVLANGVWRMSSRNALIKKLQAVEALGQANVIAVDKTGTITKNELVVKKVVVGGKTYSVTGDGYDSKGEVFAFEKDEGKLIYPINHPDLLLLGKAATYCSNADVAYSKEKKAWDVMGDPTEAAMLVFGEKIGLNKYKLEKESPLIFDSPFSYKKKYHGTIHKGEDNNFITIAGAPEVVLKLSGVEDLEIYSLFHSLSREGLRVIAISGAESELDRFDDDLPPLAFIGFLAMQDAIRPEVKNAVAKAEGAGIQVVMITGDHAITAMAIAKEAGLAKEGDKAISGTDLEKLSDDDLSDIIEDIKVFARLTPDHKLRIINSYRKKGLIVAITGDGVNDAPSLVAADLGIAMGRIGTEVAKEASDIVLLDDNLSSIIDAVEEGRGIYRNIRKVILYLFSTNIGEVFTIAVAMFLGFPLPLLAAQIIWLNLVTDGFLDVALAMEPREKDLLTKSFRRPGERIVDGLMIQRILIMATAMFIGTLFLFKGYFATDMTKALTMSLTTLAAFQWFNAYNVRSESVSIFKMKFFSNKYLIAATVLIIFLQVVAVYTPFFQKILHTSPLSLMEWGMIMAVASSIIFVEEFRKLIYRHYLRTRVRL